MNKDVEALVRDALRSGWTLVRSGRHRILRHPSGIQVSVPGTPGSGKAITAFRQALRRAERPEP